MVDVSVGVASACIAAVITILQFLLPNALALLLTIHVPDTQPAVTWSVVSRFLLTSDWPWFLRSDHIASKGVPRNISLLTWIKPVGLLLISVSAVVTPLGLYDSVGPSSSSEVVPFVYVPDPSVIGTGTPSRSNRGYNFSRLCGTLGDIELCPGDPDEGFVTLWYSSNHTTNATTSVIQAIVPESISPALTDLYQSGLPRFSPSVSSFFDIQYRRWTTVSKGMVKNNGTLLTRAFTWLSSILLDQKLEFFEGIVADTQVGGIGFRNHSLPDVISQYGYEWEEDVLWMQPETSCVNSNLTAVLRGSATANTIQTADLVDRGGFTNISRTRPYQVSPNPLSDGQRHPMLYERAYWQAWYLNNYAMLYLNITDPDTNRSRISSSVGQHFKVNSTFTSFNSDTTGQYEFGKGARFDDLIADMPYSSSWNQSSSTYDVQSNPLIPNPHNITGDNITAASFWFQGYGGANHINISTIAVQMGYIIGPATMLDQTDPNNATSVATFERPLYICSSATKVSIKTMRFRYNTSTITRSLRNLQILNMKDKIYHREEDQPLWGFEMPWRNATTTWNISEINPLWGIVDQSVRPNPNVSTVRSASFYVPAGSDSTGAMDYYYPGYNGYVDFVAGTTGPVNSWAQIFNQFSLDYRGDNMLRTRFREMTQNATSVSRLLQLMWTDYTANAMVGTRGIHTPRYKAMLTQRPPNKRDSSTVSKSPSDFDFSSLTTGHYPVYPIQRQIRYRWVFGIPALMCIGIVGLATFWALAGMLCGVTSIARLRNLMYNVSVGRVFAAFVYPELEAEKTSDTKRWIKAVGLKPVTAGARVTSASLPTWGDKKDAHVYVQVTQSDESETRSHR